MVKLRGADSLAGVAADYALDPNPIDQFGSRPIYRLRILDGVSPRDKAEALVADPLLRVVYAEPNFSTHAPEGQGRVLWAGGGSAGDYVAQWAASIIRLPDAHAVTGGFGVTVAVLDTGVDMTHPALSGRLARGFDFVDLDSDPSEVGVYGTNPLFGHGTHVAGLINLAAPDAMIMPVRVLNADGVGDEWALAEALAWAIDPDGDPNTDDGASVINLSMSTLEASSLIRDVLKAVTCSDPTHSSADDLPCFLTDARGAVVVAAAGNSSSSKPEYPAGDRIGGELAVGASTQNDTIATFSNYGSWVSLAAPGEGILSTVPGGGYGTWSGTSMATPLVAGTAALVRATSPTLSTPKVAQRIISKAADIDGAIRYRLDAASALSSSRGTRR
ncbi:MAG TPA: S8 family serine peptidase [Blastocatellia bacterium]|nr:S8 family serine peptidase [Blastocatellia bacterium]